MKTVLGIVSLILIYSCSSHQSEIAQPASAYLDVYDTLIDQVKSQGGGRISRTSLEKTEWEKFPKSDVGFVTGVMLRSVNNNDTLPTDTSSIYHIYDFRELDTLFLFSIARCDVSGFNSLYHFTLNKENKKLSGCTLIGTSRNVTDYRCNDKLTYAADGKSLIANSNAEFMEKGSTIIDQRSIRYDFYKDSTTRKLLHNVHREHPKK